MVKGVPHARWQGLMRGALTRTSAGALAWSLTLGTAAAAPGPAAPQTQPKQAPATQPEAPADDERPPVEEVTRASLEIDTTSAGPAGPVIFSRLDELGSRELRRAEVLPGRSRKDPVIKIVVTEIGGDQPGYAITSALTVEGEAVADSEHATECRLCTEGEAVERATSEIERLVPLVREQARARRKLEQKPPPAPPPKIVEPEPVGPKPLGAKGKAGIGLLAGGAVALGVGIGLAVREPTPDPKDPLREISTRGAGFAVLGVGAAAAITGAVLLGLDRRAAQRRVTWTPGLSPWSATIVLAGSF